MRRIATIALTLGLIVLVVGAAGGQDDSKREKFKGFKGFGKGFGGFGGVGMLLMNEGVQKELKLEKEQIEKAREVAKKVREKHQDDFGKLRDLKEEERLEKATALMKTIADETQAGLKDVLKPEQLKRLNQIDVQVGGLRSFSRPDVQKALTLADEQKDKIKTIGEDLRKDMRELFQGGFNQGAREKMTALNKEAMEKIHSILNADQKKAWKELTGDAFEFRGGFGGRPRPKKTDN